VTGADQSNDTAAADVNSAQDTTAASATTDTTADQTATASADTQAAGAGADQNAAADNAALPQTASPLPLLGLLGFGSTAVGAFLRRRK
jgi:LPXTG-motif cell wall-anchored protein